jgi:hypothetical protein
MRQWNHQHIAAGNASGELAPDDFIESGLPKESLNCYLADRDQHVGPGRFQLLLQPRRAVGDLLPAGFEVTALSAAGKALHHRGHIAERPELLLFESGLGQPLEQPPSGRTGKWSPQHDFLLARRLTDQHPARGIEPSEYCADPSRQSALPAPFHPGRKRGEV